MPIYQVKCKQCEKEEEILTLRISEKIPKCKCGGKRIILAPTKKSPSFKLIYNNKTDICDWDGGTSRYWDAYKKIPQKERNNFKLPGE